MFEHPINDAADAIKRALSRALVYYYPFAGRIAASGDGELHVRCHGDGVAFVAATANCALKERAVSNNGGMMMTMLEELGLYYPAAEGCRPSDPLLLMQVTEFSCGGFVLGVTWHHGIADGAGLAQFLRAVGELARGSPSPSVVPVRWDGSLPSLPWSPIVQLAPSLNPVLFARLDATIPSREIRRIKARFRDRNNGQTCTEFATVAAVLWQCRTRAIASDPGATALLSFIVNMRNKRVGAKDGYYGNFITTQQVVARSGVVVDADIVDLVKMIKCAKDNEVLLPYDQQEEGLCEALQAMEDQRQRDRLQNNMLGLTSWRNIGFEEPDFGGGTPARVMCYTPPLQVFPFCVTSLPCEGTDGASNVFSVCVKEEHADAFVAELARL